MNETYVENKNGGETHRGDSKGNNKLKETNGFDAGEFLSMP
jgi:hypothetical protein